MATIEGRHRKAAEAWGTSKFGPIRRSHDESIYAQALADVEDLNGYDLTACRAAYALVCEAVNPGVGPGGAAAVAMSVQLLRRRAERAEAEAVRLCAVMLDCSGPCDPAPDGDVDSLDAAARRKGFLNFKHAFEDGPIPSIRLRSPATNEPDLGEPPRRKGDTDGK